MLLPHRKENEPVANSEPNSFTQTAIGQKRICNKNKNISNNKNLAVE